MNESEEIVFYQTSNGTYHTSPPQEQIYEIAGGQVPMATETTQQYQEIYDGNIIEADTMQQINIINANDLVQSNNLVVQTDSEKETVLPLRRLIRLSAINTNGKGFQLDTGGQPKTINTSYVKTLNINGTITRTVLVPKKTFTTTQVDTNESILSGQYIVAHNDFPSLKPKTNIIKENGYVMQNNESNGVTVQLMDTLQPNGKILVQRIRRKNVQTKNGVQVKNVCNPTTNGVSYKMPINAVPLALKPMKKILVQPERVDLIGVEQRPNGQIRVVTDNGNQVPVSIEPQNNIVYDPNPPKTRIIFKVMQPEDFQLYNPAEVEETKVKRPVKQKKIVSEEKTITLGKTVTRSGRQVRLPKHITNTYNDLEGEDLLGDMEPATTTAAAARVPSIAVGATIEPALKEDMNPSKVAEVNKASIIEKSLLRGKRVQCITCKKVYNCIGQHLSKFPEHATTDRLKAILEKYKSKPKLKEIAPKPMKPTITPDFNNKPLITNTNQTPNINNVMNNSNMKSISDDLESKEDRNIFVSLVGIVERTSEECKASVFIRQLSALILKLKRLMPCLLCEDKSSSSCIINESVGKMLEVTPGKYRLNMNAIKCTGEQGGNCPHIPPKPPKPVINTTSSWLNSEQNIIDAMPKAETLIVNNNCQSNNDINKWNSNIHNGVKHTNEELNKSAKKVKKPKESSDIHKWAKMSQVLSKWKPVGENITKDNIEVNAWQPINNSTQTDMNNWSVTGNSCQETDKLNAWSTTVTNGIHSKDDVHKWSTTNGTNCNGDSTMQWSTATKSEEKTELCSWKAIDNSCQEKDKLSTWTSALSNGNQDKSELNNWKTSISNGCQNKDDWSINSTRQDKEDISKWATTINNACQGKSDLSEWNASSDKDELDKWTSTTKNGKRKWIPIGTRDADDSSNTNDENWLATNSDLLLDNATFPQSVSNIKRWDPLQKQSRLDDCTPRSPWQANIPELNKIDIPPDIIRPPDHLTSSNHPVPSDDSLTFDCSTKMVEDIHSNLDFDINKDISLDSDVDLKKKSIEPENFDFNDSRFDMQIDSDKLNFRNAEYNEMKYDADALPPFSKIESSKNLQIPVDSLSDISSDVDKLRLPSTDGILTELGSESLGLTISNEHIEPMDTVKTRKDVTLNQSENAVHCDDQSLLNTGDLNLPISNASTLSRNESILSVSESSLDGSRLNLSSSLNLLDSLGPDCLSFADSDLRTTSQMSLDLQDLFPFHHS